MIIFPNPTNHFLTIQFKNLNEKNIQIKIFDVLGQTVIEKKEENASGTFETQIDVSGLSAGVYTIRVNSGGKEIAKKIIVQY
jgi:hypothetical protein